MVLLEGEWEGIQKAALLPESTDRSSNGVQFWLQLTRPRQVTAPNSTVYRGFLTPVGG